MAGRRQPPLVSGKDEMKIKLFNGLYIIEGPRGCSLRQEYTGRKKDGTEFKAERTHGHYNNISDALRRSVALYRASENEDAVISISEYVNALNDADAKMKIYLEGFLAGLKYTMDLH